MAIDNVTDVDTGAGDDAGQVAHLKLDRSIVSDLKAEVGVTSHSQVAPLVNAAIAEYLGEDASEYEEAFRAQFDDDE